MGKRGRIPECMCDPCISRRRVQLNWFLKNREKRLAQNKSYKVKAKAKAKELAKLEVKKETVSDAELDSLALGWLKEQELR